MSFTPIEAKQPPLPVKVEGVVAKRAVIHCFLALQEQERTLSVQILITLINLWFSRYTYTGVFQALQIQKIPCFFIDTATEWAV